MTRANEWEPLSYEDIYEQPVAAEDLVEQASEPGPRPLRPVPDGNPITVQPWREVALEIAMEPPREFAVPGLVVKGEAVATIGAKKSTKSLTQLDYFVSRATGTKWMGRWPITEGRVVVFHGEDSKAEVQRRILAICEHRGLDLDDVWDNLYRAHPLPRLISPRDVAGVLERIAEVGATDCMIDPAYLAHQGLDMRNLYEMGAAMRALTEPAGEMGCSIWFGVHTNRSAQTRTIDKAVGAGPVEVARTLIGLEVKARRTDAAGVEYADLVMTAQGNSIPEQEYRIHRRTWSDDRDDLSSPLHTEVEVEGVTEDPDAGMHAGMRRVLAALDGDYRTVTELQDRMAREGGAYKPLTAPTAKRYLQKLADLGRVEHDGARGPVAAKWRRTDVPAQIALGE